MNKEIKRVLILGPSDGLKSKIIIETLHEMQLLSDKEIMFACENILGKARKYCKQNNIKVVLLNDPKLKEEESIKSLKECKADILVCCGWSYILPKNILDIFIFPSINCHSSLLPDYRGKRAYNHYWANMEKEYGATIHYMTEELDDGKIIVQGKLKMFPEETLQILHQRISEVTAFLIPLALEKVSNNNKGYVQKGIARYFTPISMEEAIEHRRENENRVSEGKEKKITKHKLWKI